MTKDKAMRILSLTDYTDYKVVKVYENGFKAVRTNEWFKGELYCELFCDADKIDADNVYRFTSIATMVIERYK